ncbi:DUF1616 domain-containing protein [Salinigranum sp.]|uniref:DUF1616 domain-containing protein n=1 Tax=Salinigranum sp. TaxID=1966351 RepID=UPI00356A245C
MATQTDHRTSAWADTVARVPTDLGAVGLFTLVVLGSILLPVVRDTPLRSVVVWPFVLFVPGYVVVSALFPGVDVPGRVASDDRRTRLDGLDRVLLSVGASLAVVPLVGLVLAQSPWGVTTTSLAVGTGVLVLGTSVAAMWRRLQLPPGDRFALPVDRVESLVRELWSEPPLRVALNLLVLGSVLVAAVSVGYAFTNPASADPYTEFAVLAETPDGDRLGRSYADVLDDGGTLVLSVTNREGERVSYTVVAQRQRLDGAGDVTARQEVNRVAFSLADGKRWEARHGVSATGGRVVYYLYRGDAPPVPSSETAYRTVYVSLGR